jgi:hypothetical protein
MAELIIKYKNSFFKSWRIISVLLFVFMIFNNAVAQENPTGEYTQVEPEPKDTTTYDESYKLDSLYHNPQKAALMSALLPGLGQIYNKKVWKVPIVYAGFGTMAYFISFNQKGYNLWKKAYLDFPDYDLDYDFPLTLEMIERQKNSYKRYRDLSIIGTAGFYLLQILDATVDAYLFDWNISEDISMKIEPSFIQSPYNITVPSTNTLTLRASLSF